MPVATPGETATASKTITRESIETFAELSGDHNPIHTDPDYAAETLFEGPIAHGALTAGVISAALAALSGDIIYLSQELQFEGPVRPGDRVDATASVREVIGGDRIRVETTARVPHREETVLAGEAVVLSVPHDAT